MKQYWAEGLLAGKTILVSGASSGIGRQCAIQCSTLGARVIALGRDKARLHETMLSMSGSDHAVLSCDLNSSADLAELGASLKAYGPFGGFVHCAGIEYTKPIKAFDLADFERMMRTNVAVAIELCRILSSPQMVDMSGTGYVLMSSIRGHVGQAGLTEYAASKSALYGATRSLALELARKGIRVNCVSPAMTNTPMLQNLLNELPEVSVERILTRHLMGVLEPEDVVNMVVYLISDMGARITGTNIVVDSGFSLA